MALPECVAGGEYNQQKAVAVGSNAASLAAAGQTAAAVTHAAVFGRPIGDTVAWVRDVWMRRYEARLENIRLAFDSSPTAAICAAHALRGPGGLAAHWLRTTPTSPDIRALLEVADTAWVRLWLLFAGATPDQDSVNIRSRIFSTGAACLGHLAAVDVADSIYDEGVACAWPVLARWTRDASPHVTMINTIASALGISLLGAPDPATLVAPFSGWLVARASASAAALALRRSAAGRAVDMGSGPGARSGSAPSTATPRPNLLISALAPGAGPLAGPIAASAAGVKFIIARILGLPVWRALSLPAPSSCPRCNAAVEPHLTSGDRERDSHPTPVNTRCLDAYGEHILSCQRAGLRAGFKRRHDDFARALADLSLYCDRAGRYHDGPCFQFGSRQRPADFLQKYPGTGQDEAVDVTIGSRLVGSVDDREIQKIRKYALQLRLHPDLKFSPFAVDLSGDIGNSALSMVASWSRSLVSRWSADRLPAGNAYGEVLVAVSRALTRTLALQATAWTDSCTRTLIHSPFSPSLCFAFCRSLRSLSAFGALDLDLHLCSPLLAP